MPSRHEDHSRAPLYASALPMALGLALGIGAGLILPACHAERSQQVRVAGRRAPRAPDQAKTKTKTNASAHASADGGPGMEKDQAAWQAAEAVAVASAKKKYTGEPVRVAAHAAVPYLFSIDFPTAGDYVLVHQGQVVTAQGLAALGDYLRDVHLLEHRPPSLDDLTTLLLVFDAFPPIEKGYAGRQSYHSSDESHTQLTPHLDWKPAGARLVLHYLFRPKIQAPPGLSIGTPQNPNLVKVARWTLTIPADYRLAWKEELFDFDIQREQLTPAPAAR